MKHLSMFIASLLVPLTANAVIVNGTGGGDTFATINQAVDFCISSPVEDTIEVRTNGPIEGFDLLDKTLPRPLTVKAGAGFTPVLNSIIFARPSNESATTLTLEGLRTEIPGSSDHALRIGCNVVANNCYFNHPGSSVRGYEAAVTAAYPTATMDSQVYMTSCTIIGHNAVQTGRAARDYYFSKCDITSVDDLGMYAMAIVCNMNWPPAFGGEILEYSTALGLSPISEPRNITLDRCTVTAGQCIGWPADTLFTYHYANQNNTIGLIKATNSVFANVSDASNANTIGNHQLPATNQCDASFYHCTFRRTSKYGAVYMRSNPDVTFVNTLFDMPAAGIGNAGYIVGPDGTFTGTVSGDRNAYNIDVNAPTYGFIGNARPAFEATNSYRRDSIAVDDFVTDIAGHFTSTASENLIAARAIALVPAITIDRADGNRPQPVSASANDIGAFEISESLAGVSDWQIY